MFDVGHYGTDTNIWNICERLVSMPAALFFIEQLDELKIFFKVIRFLVVILK